MLISFRSYLMLLISSLTALIFFTPAWGQIDWRSQVEKLPTSELLLLGEQHDALEHKELARLTVKSLASEKRLAALLLEMVDYGLNTDGIPIESSESVVRERLQWNDTGWSWSSYGPVVMQAVRVGVPVIGSNLPYTEMREVMSDASWDVKVPSAVLSAHRENMIKGHCGLLPDSQVPAMARIQIARDDRMARTAQLWINKGKTVLLLAGAEHVRKDRGIPLLLNPTVASNTAVIWMQANTVAYPDSSFADINWLTPPVEPKDYCAELAKSLK
jgi:uncharacterized iron-regulated protein